MRTALLFITFFLGYQTGNPEYVGIPQMTWFDASKLCPLQTFAEDEKDLTINVTAIRTREITKVWTGTRIKYSHWCAFIGCVNDVRSAISVNIGTVKDSVKECLLECSFKENQTHFALKDTNCICLSTEPHSLGKHNRCRKKCINLEKSFCNSGKGYMVFELLKDIEYTKTNKFSGDDCLLSVHQNGKNIDRNEDCKMKNFFNCKNGQAYYKQLDWISYQNECLIDSSAVLYPSNESASVDKKGYWKPVFRTHKLLSDDEGVSEGICIALNVHPSNKTTNSLEDCTQSYPFLCRKSGRIACIENPSDYPRFIAVPVTAIIASGLFVLILMIIIVSMATRLRKMNKKNFNSRNKSKENNGHELTYAPPPKRVVALRDTYIEAGDAPIKPITGAYHDVYDDVNKQFYVK